MGRGVDEEVPQCAAQSQSTGFDVGFVGIGHLDLKVLILQLRYYASDKVIHPNDSLATSS